MHIAVLGASQGWHVRDLKRAAADRGTLLSSVDYRQLSSRVEATGTTLDAAGLRLDDCDALLLRSVPAGSLEQTIFRLDALGVLAQRGMPMVNPPRALEMAVDKYLTFARLASAGLPIPETIACQTPEAALAAFDHLDGDVVLKPLFGSEGRGLIRLNDRSLAERAAMLVASHGGVLYLQRFIPHPGYDLRVLMIGAQFFAIRRHNPHDWRTNISRGAQAEPCQPSAECLELARQSAEVLGASVAGVDLLPASAGRWLVLEVNAVPGWKGLSTAHNLDVASLLLEHVESVASEIHNP